MSKPLRVGVIGSGGIARGVHLPSYQKRGDQVELTAITDVDFSRAASAASEFSIPRYFDNYEIMFREMQLDVVSVCTPNQFHHPAVLAALAAGCHVLCEKPPAMSLQQAKEMENASRQAGKHLVYGFHYRHSPEVETLKRFIDAGELGEIYAGRVHALRRRGIPGWGVFTSLELQGGGPLIDIGVHMLDTALYLMGYPTPIEVSGATYQKLGNRPGVGLLGQWDYQNFSIEDMARGFIRFSNGASIVLETSFAANVESAEEMNVTLMGDGGGANVFPLKIYQEKHDTLLDLTPVFLPQYNYHEREVSRFVDLCLGEKSVNEVPLCTAQEGVQVQSILDALYRSAALGKAVEL